MTREEAIQVLKDISWQMGSVKRWDNIEAIDTAIEALQTEVVRCKECTNFDYAFNYCDFLEAGVEGEDFFCAYGERKGGEDK